ncbi:MAG: SDR family NAD(P)-dependent oxidoreductase [Betaproteobacteria bacterium]|jgi:NAD(P)-dependent dehydrogenase (short-subunit alcohol dehydrogenase family)|nr:MAG: SDR family NAD(P)-dependent oxidoreductase [Betaproteobacteria bacterium]TAG45771.1 MAG: SDR family NAD(P)-dependent oxidoreductase [Betaproteobacteria bacterium]
MTPRHIKALFDLTGKRALITGGSRGLGLQMAHALGEAGASVVLSARKQNELDAAVAELTAAGIKASAIAADCGNAEGAQALAHATLAEGPIDILINNAGASWGAPAEDHPIEAYDKVMNVNVRGIFVLSQAIGKHCFIPRKSGCIINVASIAGLGGNPAFMKTVAYNTSKAAVINFTKALAGEWGHYGIRVNAICPGFFPSKMTAGLLAAVGEENMAKGAPLLRIGDEEDLKGLTVLFASDAGKHITGQAMAVDGGVSAILGG